MKSLLGSVGLLLLIGCARIDQNVCLNNPDCLLYKEGTNKTVCHGAPYLASAYVDNYYGEEGKIIDRCEITPGSSMIFAFKQHDQSFRKHTGTISVFVTTNNPESHQVIQVLTSSGISQGGGSWNFCGNIEDIPSGKQTRSISCTGVEIGFIKISGAEWNAKSAYLDRIEAYRYG